MLARSSLFLLLGVAAATGCKTTTSPAPVVAADEQPEPEPQSPAEATPPLVRCEHMSEEIGYVVEISGETIVVGTTDREGVATSFAELEPRLGEYLTLYPDATMYIVADGDAPRAADLQEAAKAVGFVDVRRCSVIVLQPRKSADSLRLGNTGVIGETSDAAKK